MRFHLQPKITVARNGNRSSFQLASQDLLKHNLGSDDFVSRLLDRRWALNIPDSKINQILTIDRKGEVLFRNSNNPCLDESLKEKNPRFPSFYVVRDDLLHPLVNGNKARKLDAVLPVLEDNAVTDVVTCGGCQSAHAAAVAVSCAERGIKSHLLLRGEEPETLTGYNLISRLYGNVFYVPRSAYANRKDLLARHAESIVGSNGSISWLKNILENHSSCCLPGKQRILQDLTVECSEKLTKVVIINEGAGDAMALLGLIRLTSYLSQDHLFGKNQALKIVVDAGTGTTAVGLGLGALCLGLPWEIIAIMLADDNDGYREKEQSLITEFLASFTTFSGVVAPLNTGVVHWVDRSSPRKFGKVLKGEVEECQRIAQQTGIMVDPIYTLSAWDLATRMSMNEEDNSKIVMLHTGGTLGMFGVAQRWKSHFPLSNKSIS